MDEILLLVHRIPYPPNKGDKIRSWRLLKFLTERFKVHLGCFIDDPADLQHRDFLRGLCKSAHFEQIAPRRARIASLRGLLAGEALSFPYYRTATFKAWVEKIRARPLVAEFAYSSTMAPYLTPQRAGRPTIIDFVDADSEKWRAYAERQSFPFSQIYAREARMLGAAELKAAGAADLSFCISAEEAGLWTERAPELTDKIDWYGNGVDLDFFAPRADFSPLSKTDEPVIVFTGAMDYWANVDAVTWFATEVLPRIRAQHPDVLFRIVGARPAKAVTDLNALPGVEVTGAVPDIRPYIAGADVSVAPMRIAQGVQNKVLEAMAMAVPVVGTARAGLGIAAESGQDLLMAEDEASIAAAVVQLLDSADLRQRVGAAGRALIERSYSWDAQLSRLQNRIDALGLGAAAPAPAQSSA